MSGAEAAKSLHRDVWRAWLPGRSVFTFAAPWQEQALASARRPFCPPACRPQGSRRRPVLAGSLGTRSTRLQPGSASHTPLAGARAPAACAWARLPKMIFMTRKLVSATGKSCGAGPRLFTSTPLLPIRHCPPRGPAVLGAPARSFPKRRKYAQCSGPQCWLRWLGRRLRKAA